MGTVDRYYKLRFFPIQRAADRPIPNGIQRQWIEGTNNARVHTRMQSLYRPRKELPQSETILTRHVLRKFHVVAGSMNTVVRWRVTRVAGFIPFQANPKRRDGF